MPISTSLTKNFRFLVLEVNKQVDSALRVLDDPDPGATRKLRSRDDYIDHLKSIIENKCFSYLRRREDIDKTTVDTLRSLNVIAANLEHIADHAVSIVRQTHHFSDPRFFQRYDYEPFFRVIFQTLSKVTAAFTERDIAAALEICRAEEELDRLYRGKFERILAEMSTGGQVANLITALFIFHYLERVGDCLENIGEAIIFAKMGERMKVHQFETLRDTMSHRGSRGAESLHYQGIWGTKSGATIGKVSDGDSAAAGQSEVIFKEGEPAKIRKEKENLERWSRLVPGLAPRVVDFQENDADAAILIEFLKGSTFQDIIVTPGHELLDEALIRVQGTLRAIWHETKLVQEIRPNFLGQLWTRLDDVLAAHPRFDAPQQQIGGLTLPSFKQLLHASLPLDEQLVAPFSVFGHGDFNLDNIIYNADTRQVHFIDVHRSEQMDYAQDISVLIVSAFRMPVFDAPVRERLNRVALSFYRLGQQFAAEHHDPSFPARLAAGLARSLVTSTRFEFQRKFANDMFQRALYLLELLRAHAPRAWSEFELPEDVLVY